MRLSKMLSRIVLYFLDLDPCAVEGCTRARMHPNGKCDRHAAMGVEAGIMKS